MDGEPFYGNIQSRLWVFADLFLVLQKFGLYRNHLLCRHFRLDSFQAGLSYTAEPVIIIRFCDTVAGAPADDAHAGRAVLAVPALPSAAVRIKFFPVPDS